MPGIPANITIEGRIPATIKGNLPPLINTLASARGGFRAGDEPVVPVDPVDPVVPVGEGIDPKDGYPNAWAAGSEPDWQTLLTYNGTGTPDPKFDVDNAFTFLGAFKINPFTGGTNTVIGTAETRAIAFRPPGPDNGPNGSIFLGSVKWVAELDLPELSFATNHADLPAATVTQGWTDVLSKATSDGNNTSIGWIKEVAGKLFFVTWHAYYPGTNTSNLMVANDPSDLANGSWQGYIDHGAGDHGARYMFDIPADKQETFGGTHFMGVSMGLSLVDRSSFGPSLVSFTPSDLQPEDTTIPSTRWVYYPSAHPFPTYTTGNEEVQAHYGALLFPDGEYDMFDYFDPNIDADAKKLANWNGQGGDIFDETSYYGNLGGYLSIPVAASGKTRTTMAGLPMPDESLRKIPIHYRARMLCAFVPPGSDTVMFLGENQGLRYGIPYKATSIDTRKASGGYALVESTDVDNYVYLMNLNDVASRTNTWDLDLYKGKPVNDLFGPHAGQANPIRCGYFDPATNKLYVVSADHYYNQYADQMVVSVYQVGG